MTANSLIRRNIRRFERLIDSAEKRGEAPPEHVVTALSDLLGKLEEDHEPLKRRVEQIESELHLLRASIGQRKIQGPRFGRAAFTGEGR